MCLESNLKNNSNAIYVQKIQLEKKAIETMGNYLKIHFQIVSHFLVATVCIYSFFSRLVPNNSSLLEPSMTLCSSGSSSG